MFPIFGDLRVATRVHLVFRLRLTNLLCYLIWGDLNLNTENTKEVKPLPHTWMCFQQHDR